MLATVRRSEQPLRVKLRPAIMSAVTAAFLETGKNGFGAATPPEAGEGAVQKKDPSNVRGAPIA
jgi:hypothetical protein